MSERSRTDNPPRDAFAFQAAPLAFAAEEGGQRRLQGVAYSGELIAPHSYWGAVIFDLASLELPERVPVLVDHDRAQRAGWASLAVRGGALEITEGRLLQNATGQAVGQDADDGFPWQMSVHIEPARIEEIQVGTSATVNGRAVTGPAFVFRQSRIREVTLTPTGADHRTSAQVFSTAPALPQELPVSNPQTPTVETLAADLAALQERFAAQGLELTAANDRLAAHDRAERSGQVRELFSATGMEFSDDAAAPFLAMDGATFSATRDAMKAAHKPKAPAAPAGAHLFREVATAGESANAGGDAQAIATAARQFHAEQERAGVHISMTQAVAHVRAQAAQ